MFHLTCNKSFQRRVFPGTVGTNKLTLTNRHTKYIKKHRKPNTSKLAGVRKKMQNNNNNQWPE